MIELKTSDNCLSFLLDRMKVIGNKRGGTRSLLIYKTPEVIETLNLDSDSGLVKLTDEDDGDKVYVHIINE